MSWIEAHEVAPPRDVEALDLDELAPGGLHALGVTLIEDANARAVRAPVLVARGQHPGLVVGITAALHGNELNGIPTIHRLFNRIDPRALTGTVVGVPIANVPAFLQHQRAYPDGQDLNHVMPGRPDGDEGQLYAHRLLERIVRRFDYLLDLHTASFGRINSLYVRADMTNEVTARLARLIGADIILHGGGGGGTLRAAAGRMGVHAVTIEIGDPQVFDRGKVRASRIGLRDVLEHLGMLTSDEEQAARSAIECARSYWLYTDTGGLLEVLPQVAARVRAGEPIATLHDPWGRRLRTYHAPEDGVVIGKSSNPVAPSGARILHLGIIGLPPGGVASSASGA